MIEATQTLRHSRRDSRVQALQRLFAEEFTPQPTLAGDLDPYTAVLVAGVTTHRELIDSCLVQHTRNWRLTRLHRVDRNVLRLAVYELMHEKDVPAPVVLNEAIELARAYGDSKSAAFVNGVLDAVVHGRQQRAG